MTKAANAAEVEAIFIGRGAPASRVQVTVSGTVRGWKENHHGDRDGLYLEDGSEIGFPPHRAGEVQSLIRVGRPISALGTWHGRRFHAYTIVESLSGARVEAHKLPGEGPGKMPLGHTARFVVDHALCDVTILKL